MSKCSCNNNLPVQSNCCCDFPTLVVLILIILQFGKGKGSKKAKVDNGILFIIALFFLSCCNPCHRGMMNY